MTTPRFSANLGFLWNDVALPEAIRLAATAGFDAVECHQPFSHDSSAVADALTETGLAMITLNTGVGDPHAGEFGLAAVPGRAIEARALIDEAIDYAHNINCRFVSVIAGHSGRTNAAEAIYRDNLHYAATQAARKQLAVLIEPLSESMGKDYHLVRMADAASTVRAIGATNLFVMADTFHTMSTEGSLDPIEEHLDVVGHIQISGWPDRAEPDHGINFDEWLPSMIAQGYAGTFGAEYTPATTIEAGLGWLQQSREESI